LEDKMVATRSQRSSWRTIERSHKLEMRVRVIANLGVLAEMMIRYDTRTVGFTKQRARLILGCSLHII
jgi:hypothetical protein